VNQLRDEWNHILNRKWVWVILIAPLIVSVVFGYIFKNNQINEAPIAVVDLDNSAFSLQLINKLNASQYISVEDIYHEPVDANNLLYREQYIGVVYLPSELETARTQGKQSNVGFYVDMSTPAATGNLRAAVTEVISTENSMYSTVRVKAFGLNDTQASGTVTNLSVQQRLLYNPTNDTMDTSVIGFINTFMLSLLSGAALTIVPRLREQGRLGEALENPFGIISRLIPYALVGCASFYLSIGLLKQLGGFRFEGDPFQAWIPLLLYTTSASLMAMLIGWNAATEAKASGRVLLIVMPSFLLGGTQLPVLMLPEPLQLVSNALPIAWHFKFIRGMGFRGGELEYFIPELGGFLLMTGTFLFGILFLWLNEKRKMKAADEDITSVNQPIERPMSEVV
jgi:ABC-2 type transport system permease protein